MIIVHPVSTRKRNCGSAVALKRYKSRHDAVLTIVAEWLKSTLRNCTLHADIPNSDFNPLSDLFLSQRPDIAILSSDQIICLELTVCHETNVINSRTFKQSKYMTLQDNLYMPGTFEQKLGQTHSRGHQLGSDL